MATDRWVVIQNVELVGFAGLVGAVFAARLALDTGYPQAAARRLVAAIDRRRPSFGRVWRVLRALPAFVSSLSHLESGLSIGARILMSGVTVGAIAWVVHRFYWLQWRLARIHHADEPAIASWYVENGDWLGLPVIIVCAGYALHLEPICRQFAGARWFLIPFAYGLALAVLGYWLGYPKT